MICRQVILKACRHAIGKQLVGGRSFAMGKGNASHRPSPTPITASTSLLDSYERMTNCLVENVCIDELPVQAEYFRRMFHINVTDGKLNRGTAVVQSLLTICPGACENQLLMAHAIGWALEASQACFLIADDIMDGSLTRRGRDCWYRWPDVGMMAVNDVISLQTAAYQIVSHFVERDPLYPAIIDLLNTFYRFTVFGQSLDTMTSPRPGQMPDFSKYTMETYQRITKYKTAYYTISHPVRFGMYLSRLTDPEVHQQAERIFLQIGHFFQIQDDYLDCFGDPAVTGKIGRDIEDGKCCWPIVIALSKCNKDQMSLLKQHYGIDHPDSVTNVKELYSDLQIEQQYYQFEESENQRLNREIDAFVAKYPQVPRSIFSDYLDKLFKRKK